MLNKTNTKQGERAMTRKDKKLTKEWIEENKHLTNSELRKMILADEFVEEVACFPNSSSRDLVDTMTQTLFKLRDGMYLLNPRDDNHVRTPETESRIVY